MPCIQRVSFVVLCYLQSPERFALTRSFSFNACEPTRTYSVDEPKEVKLDVDLDKITDENKLYKLVNMFCFTQYAEKPSRALYLLLHVKRSKLHSKNCGSYIVWAVAPFTNMD